MPRCLLVSFVFSLYVVCLLFARRLISGPHVGAAPSARSLFQHDSPRIRLMTCTAVPLKCCFVRPYHMATARSVLVRGIRMVPIISNVAASTATTRHPQLLIAGQGCGGSSGRGRHPLDRTTSRQGRQGCQELDCGGGGPATSNKHGLGDADHRAPGCIGRCPPTKGC